MAEVNIKKKEITEVLKVNIGDESYSLPLSTDIPYEKLKTLNTDEGILAFLREHIPEEVVSNLTLDELKSILAAWRDATLESQGVGLGES